MRLSTLLRTATLALSLTVAMAGLGTAFAATSHSAAQQQATNSAPYDSQDFVAPLNQTY